MKMLFCRFSAYATILFLCSFLCFISCYNLIGDGAKSSACEIISFSVSSQLGNTIINPRDSTVAVITSNELNLEQVKPLIKISPEGYVFPASGMEIDFSSGAVPYTVTAKNGTQQVWKVSVTSVSATRAEITDFVFYTASNKGLITDIKGTIDENNRTIAVELPYDSAVNGLVAAFVATGASVSVQGVSQVSGETAVDFNEPVTYRVRAQNNTTRDYTVTVENGCACPLRIRRGDYSIETQEDVAAFAGYTAITGRITVGGNYSNEITSFEKLKCLTSIGGWLTIHDTNGLVTLEGFNNLVSVGGHLRLLNNNALENLESLTSLNTVGDNFDISDNHLLAGLNGLECLVSIGGRLHLENNASLENLEGLSSLVSIGATLYLDNNYSLVSLEGMPLLETIGSGFYVYENPVLEKIRGFHCLVSIKSGLYMYSNPLLVTADGLSSVVSIGEKLSIYNNDLLLDPGMGSLNFVGKEFRITDNKSLCSDLVEDLRARVVAGSGIGGDILISGNKVCK
ncbi:MAG: hypothetical protein GY754_30930 [bacterium]|nr:hypothetical protein [bacterium]